MKSEKKTYLTRLVTRRPVSPASSISFPQVLKHYIKMETFFCTTRHDDNNSGAPDPPRRCAMGNRTASSLTFAVSLFKLCSTIIRGFRLNIFPSNPRQVNRHHYCSPLASEGFLLPLLFIINGDNTFTVYRWLWRRSPTKAPPHLGLPARRGRCQHFNTCWRRC